MCSSSAASRGATGGARQLEVTGFHVPGLSRRLLKDLQRRRRLNVIGVAQIVSRVEWCSSECSPISQAFHKVVRSWASKKFLTGCWVPAYNQNVLPTYAQNGEVLQDLLVQKLLEMRLLGLIWGQPTHGFYYGGKDTKRRRWCRTKS